MEFAADTPAPDSRPGLSARYHEMAHRTDRMKRIISPDGYGRRIGVCGDTIEIFIVLDENRIKDVTFIADGCINTVACANTVAHLIEGKALEQAWEVTPDEIISFLETLPTEETHCAELAVGALYLALSCAEKT